MLCCWSLCYAPERHYRRRSSRSLVKLKTNGQVTLPSALRRKAGLNVGDLLEARLEKGKITLTPKSLIESHISESIDQIRKGQFYGPFDTAEEMIESLHGNGKRSNRKSNRTVRK